MLDVGAGHSVTATTNWTVRLSTAVSVGEALHQAGARDGVAATGSATSTARSSGKPSASWAGPRQTADHCVGGQRARNGVEVRSRRRDDDATSPSHRQIQQGLVGDIAAGTSPASGPPGLRRLGPEEAGRRGSDLAARQLGQRARHSTKAADLTTIRPGSVDAKRFFDANIVGGIRARRSWTAIAAGACSPPGSAHRIAMTAAGTARRAATNAAGSYGMRSRAAAPRSRIGQGSVGFRDSARRLGITYTVGAPTAPGRAVSQRGAVDGAELWISWRPRPWPRWSGTHEVEESWTNWRACRNWRWSTEPVLVGSSWIPEPPGTPGNPCRRRGCRCGRKPLSEHPPTGLNSACAGPEHLLHVLQRASSVNAWTASNRSSHSVQT